MGFRKLTACDAWVTSNFHHLPRLQRYEPLARNLRFIQRRVKRGYRRVDSFVGELEGAVMMREGLDRAAIGQRLYGVVRVHMLVLHEPARLVGADRQDRRAQRAMGLRDTTKMRAVAVAGIADDVD